eukprot:Clim_evm3s216 gene=Clim_evmTU3s216
MTSLLARQSASGLARVAVEPSTLVSQSTQSLGGWLGRRWRSAQADSTVDDAAAAKEASIAARRKKMSEGPDLTSFIRQSLSKEEYARKKREKRAQNRLPPWLKTNIAMGADYHNIKTQVEGLGLATVCQEARCPNIGECWAGGPDKVATATIMVMGDTCTRACRFCSIKTSNTPPPLDVDEPIKTADAVSKWGVEYVVLTSVDRDDLPDGGASHFAEVVKQLKAKTDGKVLVETLTPDFQGDLDGGVRLIVEAGVDVYAHNLETVEALQRKVRDRRANYAQSMSVLAGAKKFRPDGALVTKTSLMLGCGETDDQIMRTMEDLRKIDVDAVTFGQYMQPTKRHMPVTEYVKPEKFDYLREVGESMGFKYVASGPLVRSSYKAGEFYMANIVRARQDQATI